MMVTGNTTTDNLFVGVDPHTGKKYFSLPESISIDVIEDHETCERIVQEFVKDILHFLYITSFSHIHAQLAKISSIDTESPESEEVILINKVTL